MSGIPSGVITDPRTMATPSRIWKNCDTDASSSSGAWEFHLRNAAFTKREAGEKSPGSPTAPSPLPERLQLHFLREAPFRKFRLQV